MVEVSKRRTLEAELGQVRNGAKLLQDLIRSLSILLEGLNTGIASIIEAKKKRDIVFREQSYQAQLADRKALNRVVRFFANIFTPVKKSKGAISKKLNPPSP